MRSDNMGWRYVYFTSGGVIFLMSVLRMTTISFHETPRFLLGQNDDEGVIRVLSGIANKYNRPFDLTVENLQSCGQIRSAHATSRASLSEVIVHYRGLFRTKKLRLSTSLLWLSWMLIGLAYPLFYIFLPDYLSSRGASLGETSTYLTWRNYAITNACGIPGPVIAGYLSRTKLFGRKYTMVIGGVISCKC